jgi:guanylate kinase
VRNSAGNKKRGFILVVSGPSGSGKTTLVKELLKDRLLKSRIIKSVSLTTRQPRSAEKEGRDYFFVARKDFLRLRREKKILEWTKYLGYYYGTPREYVRECLNEGKLLVMCLDYKGAQRIKRAYPFNSVSVFVKPPSLEVLRGRIRGRCLRTSEEEIHLRLIKAGKEMRMCDKHDYCVVNSDLKHAAGRLKQIIKEKLAVIAVKKGRV